MLMPLREALDFAVENPEYRLYEPIYAGRLTLDSIVTLRHGAKGGRFRGYRYIVGSHAIVTKLRSNPPSLIPDKWLEDAVDELNEYRAWNKVVDHLVRNHGWAE